MNPNRTSAVIVGVLFIAATVFYIVGQFVHGPVIGSPDYLQNAYPQRLTVILGVLVELAGILVIPLIAVYMLPVLRKYNQGFAVGYVVFRSIEALLLMGVSICTLALIPISKAHLGAAGVGATLYREIGPSIQAVSHWTFLFGVGLVFPITALMLNAVLYRWRLVPRVISAWGFLAAALLLTGTVLDFFELLSGISGTTLEAVLSIPIAVQEMVFALWLIFKGFNPGAINADPDPTGSSLVR